MAFMRHEGWRDALFLHWAIPEASALFGTLSRRVLPDGLELDTKDGCAWIGLVLLTEDGVGPSVGALRAVFPLVTHLGCNVRTYVKDKRGGNGIFFLSLECDSLLAAAGANVVGIPYRMANMTRSCDAAGGHQFFTSRKRLPRLGAGACAGSGEEPFSVSAAWTAAPCGPGQGAPGGEGEGGADGADPHAVEDVKWRNAAAWFVERYHVYARRLAVIRGTVRHPPWPLSKVSDLRLSVSGVDSYWSGAECGPRSAGDARTLLAEMSSRAPDHACFSEGVGPIVFEILRPV